MVTIAIICIMAAIALPSLGGLLSRKSIEHQADQLEAFIHQAREHALRDGVQWRILFKPQEQQWFAFGDINANSHYDSTEQRLGPYTLVHGITFGCKAPTGPNNTAIAPDGISFTDNRICVSPMGSCNAGTIYLSSSDRSIALRVLPASGTVLLYEYITSWSLLR
jgi:Tfp pilus assembly protein FimT